MTFADFLALATRTFDEKADLRYGQHWFNTLYEVRPDIANKVRGSIFDPFHRDIVSDQAIMFVVDNW